MKKTIKGNMHIMSLALLLGLFSSYAYAVADTTMLISSAKKVNKENLSIRTEIAALENNYFDRTKELDQDLVSQASFVQHEKIFYANLNADTRVAFNY